MSTLNSKYESPSYWTQLIQLELFENIKKYIDDNNLTQTEFANRLGVSKGYVSQILNGDFNHRLSKLVELALACDMVPKIEFIPKAYAEKVARNTYIQPTDWKLDRIINLNLSHNIIAKCRRINFGDKINKKNIGSYDIALSSDKWENSKNTGIA